jgi:hypothetical protein
MSFCISLANLCKSLCVSRGCGPGTRVEGKLFDFENEVFENEQGVSTLLCPRFIESQIVSGSSASRKFRSRSNPT